MSTKKKRSKLLNTLMTFNPLTISLLLILMMGLIWYVIDRSEKAVATAARQSIQPKPQTELDYNSAKILTEIQKNLSETSGSLFWLKLVALFVTVGGAIGGYLVGQSQNSQRQIEFERRKNVDGAYQTIIQELANKELPILRATAAVKLGTILEEFPNEWNVSDERAEQIVRQTKQVLAAGLAMEKDDKLLKTLTIHLMRHKVKESDPKPEWVSAENWKKYSDARKLDLSEAKANRAFWADTDFSGTDFFNAKLAQASFRRSILDGVSFFHADLSKAVLAEARGTDTVLAYADLRGANLKDSVLENVSFEGAKVYGVSLTGARLTNASGNVDVSKYGDGTEFAPVTQWLQNAGISH